MWLLGFRYTCEQGEDIHGYGWDEYDARDGGVQTIHDEGNKIDITTSFIKVPGGDKGGSWAARIKGELRSDAPEDLNTMIIYYVAQEGEGSLVAEGTGDDKGFTGDVTLKGGSEALGVYNLVITAGEGQHPQSDHEISSLRSGETTNVNSGFFPPGHQWQGKGIVFNHIQNAVRQVQEEFGDDASSPPPTWQIFRTKHSPGSGNVHAIQKVFTGSFEFDVIFSSASSGKDLTSADITRQISTTSQSFNERFSSVFKLATPFQGDEYRRFAKSMFSNLLGGIGYFQGHQLIDRSYAPEYDEESEGFWEEAAVARARKAQDMEGPYELFTSVPSRPFFPRGFLWDEGFHLIPIADWDIDLTLEIIKSWFNTIDKDGWIAREQILGPEARSKVPEEFQVQYPHYANPPTLFLIMEGFMERLLVANGTRTPVTETFGQDSSLRDAHIENVELGEDYLRKIYPLLRRQYDWFRKTQRGEVKAYDRDAFSSKEAYRWRGRTETHVLTSGLDDYPRPQPPHPGELHVDLISWIGLMTKSLIRIAGSLGMTEDVHELEKNLAAIKHNLNDLHWSEKDGCFCDATIDDFEEHKLVCHKGYISLFPFLLGLLDPSDPKAGKVIDLIADEEELWSPYGIRSLSQKDEFYETGENYWRSPVWMPINYLVVTQLRVSLYAQFHSLTSLRTYTRIVLQID